MNETGVRKEFSSFALGLSVLLAGCGGGDLQVYAPSNIEAPLSEFVAFLDREDVRLETEGECRRTDVQLVYNDTHPQCYRFIQAGGCTQIEGDLLGLQYGLSALLEEAGFGFFHPQAGVGPKRIRLSDDLPADWQCPDMERRGIHMHTLHPIEGYFDAWEPKAEFENMRRVGDWIIKNRGNYIQWVGLDSMPPDWKENSAALVEALQSRGLEVGLGVQLFGESNLQQAFDLVDDGGGDLEAQMTEQWSRVSDVGFDVFNLSFGEFFSAEAENFIASVNQSYAVLQDQAPGAQMTSVLHVGDDLRVEYEGQEWIYYLLAQFADEEIIPWVHTVMYYNLYEDAGGAYHHEEFDQHRALIEQYLEDDRPVGYFPESAYWCAFDSSIPQYLPVYMRSRWTDLSRLEGLNDHVLFSSGWEWGYWLHDVATLRMNWKVPDNYCDTISTILAPLDLPELAPAICDLAEIQHQAMIVDRLGPWTASLDAAMEAGAALGIVAQPLRPGFDALSESHTTVAEDLRLLATDTQAILDSLPSQENPWLAEVVDGMTTNVLRARFMANLIEASVTTNEQLLHDAERLFDEASTVIARRHQALWDPEPERLLVAGDNHSFYDYGYLYQAEEMCFWMRELTQVKNHLTNGSDPVPSCVF